MSQGGPARASESLREIDALRQSQQNRTQFTMVSLLLGSVRCWPCGSSCANCAAGSTRRQASNSSNCKRAALTDSLTGIRNHRAFEKDIDKALAHAQREREDLGLVLVDVNGLKAINDGKGHRAGDQAIRAAAHALAEAARASDGVFRIGGDEFAALLPGASARDTFRFAERLHELLASGTTDVTVSVGVTEASEDSTRDGLIEEADIALMEAKVSGRDTVVFRAGMTRPESRNRRPMVTPL